MVCSGSCSSATSPPTMCRCRCNGAGHGIGAMSAGRPTGGRGTRAARPRPGTLSDATQAPPGAQGANQAARIRDALHRAGLDGVRHVREFGSHARGTAGRNGSDRDYLVVMSRRSTQWGENRKRSDTVLDNLRRALQEEHPGAEVVRDGQAIRVRGPHGDLDVVPAVYEGPAPNSGHPVYSIPDGEGGWMRTSPDAYTHYLRGEDGRSRGQLRSTVRGLKSFRDRTSRPVPVKSIYMEMVVARSGAAVGVKRGDEAIRDGLCALRDSGCRPIDDPTGVGDPITATRTPAQRERAMRAVARAAERAERAVEARERGDKREAGRLWRLVFTPGGT